MVNGWSTKLPFSNFLCCGWNQVTNVGVSFNYGGVNYEQTIQIYEYDIQYYPTFTFYLNTNNYTTLNGDINIANNQSPGTYDLEVYDFDTESWVLAESIFTIYEPTSFDVIARQRLPRPVFKCNIIVFKYEFC